MAWTYGGDPAASDKDAVRFLVGDTDSAAQLVSDEEIDYAISSQPGVQMAAASVCDAIAAKLSRQEGSTGRRSGSFSSNAAQAYADRAKRLRSEAASGAEWFFGGQSKSGKRDLASDTDAVQPHFRVGQHDQPSVSSDSPDWSDS